MTIEQTALVIKPGWKGRVAAIKMVMEFINSNCLEIDFQITTDLTREFWEKFYSAHQGRSYFEGMMTYLTSDPSIFLVLKGETGTIELGRKLVKEVRDYYGKTKNDTDSIIHGSDSPENAQIEIALIKEFGKK